MVRVFLRRLINEGIFNNRVLFENNKLLFPYCFLRIFVGDKALDGGDEVVMGQSFPSGGTGGPMTYVHRHNSCVPHKI